MRTTTVYEVGGGVVENRTDGAWRLRLPALDGAVYADAQIDDYGCAAAQFAFVHRPPATLRLRARFSHHFEDLHGTAGFGWWNHPLTPGGGATPRSLWFFHGSRESDLQFARDVPGRGFKAALFDALPIAPAWRLPHATRRRGIGAASTAAPGLLERMATWLLHRRTLVSLGVRTAQHIAHARERILDVDATQWHEYEIDWRTDYAAWRIDGREVFRAERPPHGPLGFVAWIDNYRATFTRDGRFAFETCAAPHEQWLEIEAALQYQLSDSADDFAREISTTPRMISATAPIAAEDTRSPSTTNPSAIATSGFT